MPYHPCCKAIGDPMINGGSPRKNTPPPSWMPSRPVFIGWTGDGLIVLN